MNNKILVSHLIGLNGIGGVQSNFVEYMNSEKSGESIYQHKIYTIGSVDDCYQLANETLNIKKIQNLFKLFLDILSSKVIVHFYNNLSSWKVALFLLTIPVKKLIIHERGTVWNQKSSKWIAPYINAWKSSIILSNSFATKAMLIGKFSIYHDKVKVLHNGINISVDIDCEYKKDKSKFVIGFIGRLDSPKGVHVLINAMNYIDDEKFKLKIAGDGELTEALKESSSLDSVEFIGRIDNSYKFIKKIDLLVVPSIREPLGNVCLEAGLCKTPVLAANIDGIPEIIEDNVTGFLIEPTDDILFKFPKGSLPLPEFVINPINLKMTKPKQINASMLARKIISLSGQPGQLSMCALNLNEKVVEYFNIERYKLELHNVYYKMHSLEG